MSDALARVATGALQSLRHDEGLDGERRVPADLISPADRAARALADHRVRPGTHLNTDALRAWMLARTERYKVPDVFHLRDTLPTGSSGKADRRAVAQLARRDND